ncbi:hypothetical protein Tco_0234538 [Tanacetum coccineum]
MQISAWMITEEMKLMEHYKMYEAYRLSLPRERIRTPSAPRQSARLTPPAPVPSTKKADEMILQDMIQHLATEEIEKLVEDLENVYDSSPPRHDDTSILDTRLEPRSDKESPEV